MPKQNGGVVGPTNNPTSSVASGVWDMDEQYAARLANAWPGMNMQATGGIEVTSGTNKWHIFTSSGSFNVTSAGLGLVDVLVVAGGGTGGDANDNNGAGGGGGGVVFRPANPIVAANYSITVGAGTASAPYPNANNAGPGGNSQFGTAPQTGYLKANGGGSGNPSLGANPNASANGGSGGGGGGTSTLSGGTGNQPSEPGDSGLYGYGQPGGTAPGAGTGGSGGGGGQAGSGGIASGGNGALIPAPFMDPALPLNYTGNIPSSDPSWRYFGGGGGTGNNLGTGGAGGLGQISQAGQGGNSTAGDGYGRAGQALRGGGGGGNGDTTSAGSNPGAGGPGIVIVRYSTV